MRATPWPKAANRGRFPCRRADPPPQIPLCGGRAIMVLIARANSPPHHDEARKVKQVEVAVIGTGWCGGIRSETLSRSALVDKLHVCEIRPDRLAEIKALTRAATATLDYQDIIKNPAISVVYICTTPEQTHFPIARDCLKARKHVLLE